MEYDLDIEHISGIKNQVAGATQDSLLLTSSQKEAQEYSRLTVPVTHAPAVLAIPENGELSTFRIPHKLYQTNES